MRPFTPHPRRMITRGALIKRQNKAKKRPGPDPVLSLKIDPNLVDWLIGMHSQGYPVN